MPRWIRTALEVIIAIVATVYVESPLDLIPDPIPGGGTDDAAVVVAAVLGILKLVNAGRARVARANSRPDNAAPSE
jgi:uncharacterized membrane protein YkvA (DUF1232 family)